MIGYPYESPMEKGRLVAETGPRFVQGRKACGIHLVHSAFLGNQYTSYHDSCVAVMVVRLQRLRTFIV